MICLEMVPLSTSDRQHLPFLKQMIDESSPGWKQDARLRGVVF